MSKLKSKTDNKMNKKNKEKNDEKEEIGNLILYANIGLQILSAQLFKYLTNIEIKKVDVISDAIILSLSNIVLYKASEVNTHLTTTLKEIYYPLTSTLFYSAYNYAMYDESYIKSLSLIVPITIGEYYGFKKIYG